MLKGWTAQEIVEEHRRLGGVFDLSVPEDVDYWQSRWTLYRIADGISANDPACVELAIRYIELRDMESCTGFLRSLFARRLKHAQLADEQKLRLHIHFCTLVVGREYSWEFRDYVKLWRLIMSSPGLQKLLIKLRDQAKGKKGKPEWFRGELKMEAVLRRPQVLRDMRRQPQRRHLQNL